MAQIMELNMSNFEDIVKSGVVLVDFWAPWCGPCRMQGAILEKMQATIPDEVTIAKVNVDENRDLAVKFGVTNIPRLFLFKNGEVIEEFSGIQTESKLVDAVRRA